MAQRAPAPRAAFERSWPDVTFGGTRYVLLDSRDYYRWGERRQFRRRLEEAYGPLDETREGHLMLMSHDAVMERLRRGWPIYSILWQPELVTPEKKEGPRPPFNSPDGGSGCKRMLFIQPDEPGLAY